MEISSLAYSAGFFDGEGCVSIVQTTSSHYRVPRIQLRVFIRSTTVSPLLFIQGRFGGVVKPRKVYNLNWKPQYEWVLTTKAASNFLAQILPWLLVKREQALLAIELQSYKTGRAKRPTTNYLRQKEILNEMKRLNK